MHHVLGCLNLATQTFPLTNAAESHTYNLKAVYTVKYLQEEMCLLCGNVSKLQYFGIYFSKFSWEGIPLYPSSSTMQIHTPLPKRLVPSISPPLL